MAAYSAMGATREGIVQAAKEDYSELIRDSSASGYGAAEEARSA